MFLYWTSSKNPMVASSWNWDSKPSYLEPCWLHLQRSWFRSVAVLLPKDKGCKPTRCFFKSLARLCLQRNKMFDVFFYQKGTRFGWFPLFPTPFVSSKFRVEPVKPALSMRSSPIRICLSLGGSESWSWGISLDVPGKEVLGSKVKDQWVLYNPYIYTNHL